MKRVHIVAVVLGLALGAGVGVAFAASGSPAMSPVTGDDGGAPTVVATFATAASVAIDHTGAYTWTSPEQTLPASQPFPDFATSVHADGAQISGFHAEPQAQPDGGVVMVVSFNVDSFTAPASVTISSSAGVMGDSQS